MGFGGNNFFFFSTFPQCQGEQVVAGGGHKPKCNSRWKPKLLARHEGVHHGLDRLHLLAPLGGVVGTGVAKPVKAGVRVVADGGRDLRVEDDNGIGLGPLIVAGGGHILLHDIEVLAVLGAAVEGDVEPAGDALLAGGRHVHKGLVLEGEGWVLALVKLDEVGGDHGRLGFQGPVLVGPENLHGVEATVVDVGGPGRAAGVPVVVGDLGVAGVDGELGEEEAAVLEGEVVLLQLAANVGEDRVVRQASVDVVPLAGEVGEGVDLAGAAGEKKRSEEVCAWGGKGGGRVSLTGSRSRSA